MAPEGIQQKLRPTFSLLQTRHSTPVRQGELESLVWNTLAGWRLSAGQTGVEFIHTDCV